MDVVQPNAADHATLTFNHWFNEYVGIVSLAWNPAWRWRITIALGNFGQAVTAIIAALGRWVAWR
jgi:hypothetical protein